MKNNEIEDYKMNIISQKFNNKNEINDTYDFNIEETKKD